MPGGWTEYGNPSLPVSIAERKHREWEKEGTHQALKCTYTRAGLRARLI